MVHLKLEGSFQGGVFHPGLEHGRAGAQISFSHDGVTASTPDGGQYSVPYRACEIQIGGASGRMVFCRDQANELTIFCENKKFLEALREREAISLPTNLTRLRSRSVNLGASAWSGLSG